jgi:hypothetical protein
MKACKQFSCALFATPSLDASRTKKEVAKQPVCVCVCVCV